MKKLSIVFALCLFSLSGTAQIRIYKSDPQKNITLDGPADSLTIIACFGKPTGYETYYDNEYYSGQVANYRYEDFNITCVDNVLVGFDVNGPEYPVRVRDKYTVRVGDSIVEFMRKFSAKEAMFRPRGNQILLFEKLPDSTEFADLPTVFIIGTTGKITSIVYTD